MQEKLLFFLFFCFFWQEKLLGLLKAKRLPVGVSQLPGGKWGAHVHVGGRPMWGRLVLKCHMLCLAILDTGDA